MAAIEDNIECPVCHSSGSVRSEHVMFKGSKHSTQCNFCWGVGYLPPLVVAFDEKTFARLAAFYWTCQCEVQADGLTYERLHPDNHEYCTRCGMQSEDGKRALIGYVQAYFKHFYNLEVEIVQPDYRYTGNLKLLTEFPG